MRELTSTEQRIMTLLAHGVRPKSHCQDSLPLIWHNTLESCDIA